jgi:hypothetical protein
MTGKLSIIAAAVTAFLLILPSNAPAARGPAAQDPTMPSGSRPEEVERGPEFEGPETAINAYEAEDAALQGATVSTQNPGYKGTGYVGYANVCHCFVEWTVKVRSAGTYQLCFRYANGSAKYERPLEIQVNGRLLHSARPFPPTGGWSAWNTVSAETALEGGVNTIRATVVDSRGPNLDRLVVLGPESQFPKAKGPTRSVSPTGPTQTEVTEPGTGITLSVDTEGPYSVALENPSWTFAGDLERPLQNVIVNEGSDAIGSYKEITFEYDDACQRTGGIRTYADRPVVLFTSTTLERTSEHTAFPAVTYPGDLRHLAYHCLFGAPSFLSLSGKSPWVFFDPAGNGAFVISPADTFMLSHMSLGNGVLTSGIDTQLPAFRQDFSHGTILAFDAGIHEAWKTWGQALTDWQGKVRPASDADVGLKYFGYWTDAGAVYYYHHEPSGYEDTLLGVKASFDQKGIPLGWMQLDSWWYPKGPAAEWSAGNKGIWTYDAHPDLFPNGLKDFQQRLGLPLLTHSRWIDGSSPYRDQYKMSGDVIIDPLYWLDRMAYLADNGVFAYEQDWLNGNAAAAWNSIDHNDGYFDNMAGACSVYGLTMQYCMPLPCHYLQGTKYSNLTTMRVSLDRFQRDHWDAFLYASILARAVGVWPWADVCMSSEKANMILQVLSAGMVGVGDRIGSENKENILLTSRKDAVIVKPDVPIVPTGETILQDAAGQAGRPMVASTHTDHGSQRTVYLFAYTRSGDTSVSFSPAPLGLAGQVYLYDFNAETGRIVEAGEACTEVLAPNGYGYYILSPVRSSGIAFLGDSGKFASMGKQRISHVEDGADHIEVTIAYAAGEEAVTLHGYAPTRPAVTALAGTAGAVSYNETSKRFTVEVTPGPGYTATIRIEP